MQRYHITLGAHTNVGGQVISASSCCSIDGVRVALEGDLIFCPVCKSNGKIKIFGPRIPESWNGTQVALQDDLCVCKCTPPPRLIASQHHKWQVVDGEGEHEAAAVKAAACAREETQSSALGAQPEKIALRLLDEFTQLPLGARRYRLELPGKVIEGSTDSNGYTQPLDAADRAQLIAWQILE